jgi:Flp pilus assembly protein TadG
MLRSRAILPASRRRGMVTVQIVVSMTVLMAMLALLVDGGLLIVERRHAQATADAAALAAASDLWANWKTNNGTDVGGTAASSALRIASSNGYTNDGTTNYVTVNIPPKAGSFAGDAGYVEVVVQWNQQRGFSGVVGSGTIPVSARAVAVGASSYLSGSPGILLLGSPGTTLSIGGNGTVTVNDPNGYTGTGGSIYVDSTGPDAVSQQGNHAEATAPYVYLSQTGSAPSGVVATNGSVTTGAPQLADPLSYLPAPSATSPPTGINVISLPNGITGSTTLQSNTIYIVGGSGISLSGQQTLTGTNVMLYLTGANAAINLTGQGAVNLTPMTTGPYAGIIIFQDRSDYNGGTMKGNGNLNISGTIYAPAANITAVGNGSTDVFASQIIANSMTMKGNGTVNVDFDSNVNAAPATRSYGLVE